MIQVDISNIWGDLELRDLLGIEQEIFAAHAALGEAYPKILSAEESAQIIKEAEAIRADSEICVAIGSAEGCLEARAAMELLQGMKATGNNPRILFAPGSLSTRKWNALKGKLEGKEISVIVFGETGTEEDSPALRGIKWMLERRLGTDECSRRIHAGLSPEAGALLLMAVAGMDIAAYQAGQEEARREYDLRSFENPVWLYTAVRSLMRRSGRRAELLSFWEPGCEALGKWWQHRFLAAEKGGVFSLGMELPQDLCPLGASGFYETMIRLAPEDAPCDMASGVSGMDALEEQEERVYLQTLEDHADMGIPVITMDCGAPDARTLGYLAAFLKLSSALSGCVGQREGAASGSGE